jgi:hypothetical protein
MLARVIALGIIAFWLVMMTLLIRSELLQTTPVAYAVPVETVMQKIFEGEESSDLAIFYQGARVGCCSMQVLKDKKAPRPQYRVRSSLLLNFQVFGKPVRLQSDTDSEFDRRYQMTRFESHTVTGDSKIDMKGDLRSQEIEFVLQFGDGYQEKHKMPFATLEKMGPSGAMGLMGMGGLQLPDSASAKSGTGAWAGLGQRGSGPTTTVQEIPLQAGRQKIHSLMVYTRYDESLWSKVYVSPVGEVLKVETSFGVSMLNAQFAGDAKN